MDKKESRGDEMCKCGFIESMAEDPASIVEYDEGLNEYSMISGEGGSRILLRFCFVCGGALPSSKRGEYFTQVDRTELERIANLLKGASHIDDFISRLGNADEIVDADGLQGGSLPSAMSVRASRYSIFRSVMTTGDIIVLHDETGNAEYVVAPKLRHHYRE